MKPQLNFNSHDYIGMINWENECLYEPPYTQHLDDDDLKKFELEPLQLDICSNSVLTERTIRDVDSVSSMSTSSVKRDGMIRAMHENRQKKKKLAAT